MYDKLINRLRELHPEEYDDEWGFVYDCQRMTSEAADAIEKLQEDNAALNGTVSNLIQQIEELSKPRWIPVEEQLPEQNVPCAEEGET